ncbi:MAG: hypothetical protein NUV65_03015 [Candidatus Roizmanbacteria bacterium]|nr:hypothetical protein [Candidatus Roizmanbacteria bacterium]
MDIIDLKRKFELDEKKEIIIFNPLPYDVTHKYDGKEYTIISNENGSFTTHLAKHLGNNLVDLYLSTKQKNYPREKAEKLVFP